MNQTYRPTTVPQGLYKNSIVSRAVLSVHVHGNVRPEETLPRVARDCVYLRLIGTIEGAGSFGSVGIASGFNSIHSSEDIYSGY